MEELVDVGVKIVTLGHIKQILAGGSVVFAMHSDIRHLSAGRILTTSHLTLELLRRLEQVKERNPLKHKRQQSTRHRKFIRKIVHLLNYDEVAERPVEITDRRVVEAGQVNQRGDRPGQEPLRRSTRLQSCLERRC